MHFVTCPKQGLEIEAVVLHRVGFLAYFCPKQGQDFKPSSAPLYPNMGQVPPPPPGVTHAHHNYKIQNALVPKRRTLLTWKVENRYKFSTSVLFQMRMKTLVALQFYLSTRTHWSTQGSRRRLRLEQCTSCMTTGQVSKTADWLRIF